MADIKTTSSNWTSTQAYVLATICLVLGGLVGWFVRGSSSPAAPAPTAATSNAPAGMGGMGMGGMDPSSVTPEQMRRMAEKQAEPLLAQLKSNPNDPKLNAQVGNIFYDTQLYQDAIKYYSKALESDSKNVDVRTDMATANFYLGNTDEAINQFSEVLNQKPNHPNALFNRGIVKWQGKMDVKGAVADWETLLKTNPDYPERATVEKYIAQAKQHSNIAPGTKTSKPAAN